MDTTKSQQSTDHTGERSQQNAHATNEQNIKEKHRRQPKKHKKNKKTHKNTKSQTRKAVKQSSLTL